MKTIRWIVAGLAALIVGSSTVASAPVAAAADGDYVAATVGCGFVDLQNVSSEKVIVVYGDPNRKKEDGVFALDAGASKHVVTARTRFFFGVTNADASEVLQVSSILKPQACPKVTAPTPKISGKTRVGEQLTAVTTGWGPDGVQLSYQWYRSGKKISDATSSTYTLTKSDKDKKITVKVTGALDGYFSATKTSKATAKVKAGVLTSVVPSVSGTAAVGSELTADPGVWAPAGVKLSYQWYRGGSKIKGATGTSYTPVLKDLGKKLTFKVTGSLAGYTTKTVSSVATAKVIVTP